MLARAGTTPSLVMPSSRCSTPGNSIAWLPYGSHVFTGVGVPLPKLSSLIDLPSSPLISIVGAGGKTTTMYTLARELAHRGKRVVTTTTTQIFTPTSDETEKLIIEAETAMLLNKVKAAWGQHRRITVAT